MGHQRCTAGAPAMYRWGTSSVYMGHQQSTDGAPTVYRWDTSSVQMGHQQCTDGSPAVYIWGTSRVKMGHQQCTDGTPAVYRWGTSSLHMGTRRVHMKCLKLYDIGILCVSMWDAQYCCIACNRLQGIKQEMRWRNSAVIYIQFIFA